MRGASFRSGPSRRVLALTTLLLLPGCVARTADQSRAASGPGSSEGNVAGHVKRGKEKIKAENDLRQLGLLVKQYETLNGSTPADLDAFASYAGGDGAFLVRDVREGKYVVRWGKPPSPTTVFAYEKNVDLNGNQVVLMTDGSVQTMKAADLQKELKKGT